MADPTLPRLRHRRHRLRQVDAPDHPRPCRRPLALLRARALAGGHQPAHAVAAPARAGGAGHRRAADLPRGPAAGRVRADREGPRAAADHRGHARLRPPLARRRRLDARTRARPRRPSPSPNGRLPDPADCKRPAPGGAPAGGEPPPYAKPHAPRALAGVHRGGGLSWTRRRTRAPRSPSRSWSRPGPAPRLLLPPADG